MPIKELWGVYICEECELANKEFVEPKNLNSVPMIVSMNKFMQQKVNSWLCKNNGNMIVGKGNLMMTKLVLLLLRKLYIKLLIILVMAELLIF